MKRRDVLRYLGYSCALGSGLNALFSPIARAQHTRTLVVIFQRGGCDGLNMIVPYGDERYSSLRRTIAIAPPDVNHPDAALDLDGFFGLHPALAPLTTIYDVGDLAILPTVHYDNATRSHFSGQKYLENAAALSNVDGWLNRYLQHQASNAPIPALNFGNHLAQALRGTITVPVLTDLRHFIPDGNGYQNILLSHLTSIYQQQATLTRHYTEPVHQAGQAMLTNYELINSLELGDYNPSNGATYPSSLLGRQLMQTAQLIKADIGLEVVTLNSSGWDTHSSQGGAVGRQANALRDLGQGLAALYHDLGSHMQDVLMLTMTEFGRTAELNGSAGTDHGHAAAWLALGRRVIGGLHLGPSGWPGLAEDQLVNGRYLAHTIDYRDVLGEILSRHLGVLQPQALLLDHSYQAPGFLTT